MQELLGGGDEILTATLLSSFFFSFVQFLAFKLINLEHLLWGLTPPSMKC